MWIRTYIFIIYKAFPESFRLILSRLVGTHAVEAFLVDASLRNGPAQIKTNSGGDSIHVPCYADESDAFFAGEVEQRL